MLKFVPARSERTRQTLSMSATATKRFARAVVVTTLRSPLPTGTATAYSKYGGSSSRKRTSGSLPSNCFQASGPGALSSGETYWRNCSALPSCSAIEPHIPPGASVLLPLNPTTRQRPSFGAGSCSASTFLRNAASCANKPNAIMLCVLPPPIDCESKKTDDPAPEPTRCRKARSTSVSIPLVKKFSSKNAAPSISPFR